MPPLLCWNGAGADFFGAGAKFMCGGAQASKVNKSESSQGIFMKGDMVRHDSRGKIEMALTRHDIMNHLRVPKGDMTRLDKASSEGCVEDQQEGMHLRRCMRVDVFCKLQGAGKVKKSWKVLTKSCPGSFVLTHMRKEGFLLLVAQYTPLESL
eukprot:1137061-Pelagomonas_calceolata.AAC.4